MGPRAAAVTLGAALALCPHTGAAAPTEPVPVATADDPLPVDLLDRDAAVSPKKVYAHYFTPYPISIDNRPAESDYYATEYLDPEGEDGKHRDSGGLLRQRPLPRPVIESDDWQLEDMRTEVRRAIAAGLDGFTVDLLALEGYHWNRLLSLIEAVEEVDPEFDIVLMPDATTSVVDDPEVLAAAIAGIADSPAIGRLDDGRLVVSPFAAERRPAEWWSAWMGIMDSTYGQSVALFPVLQDYWSNADAFASISVGLSTGMRGNTAANDNIALPIADARARGVLWMQPIALQDNRPHRGTFDEAGNTETLRLTWQAAIDGSSEWVHLFSWNDYSENTSFAPSTSTGWSPLDISAYYIDWFRTGVVPDVARDVVYVSGRTQPYAAVPTGGQTLLMQPRDGGTAPRDTVEVLTMLTAPATLEVTIGATTRGVLVPAGLSAAVFPLELGSISLSIRYPDGSVLSLDAPWEVVAAPVVQDLLYHFASTARDGQFVTPAPPPTEPPPASAADTSIGNGNPSIGNGDTGTAEGSSAVPVWLIVGAGAAVVALIAVAMVRRSSPR